MSRRLVSATLLVSCAGAPARDVIVARISDRTVAAPAPWQWEHPTPLGGTFHAMHGAGSVVHAVGARGALAVSYDAARTWSALASGTVADLRAIAGDDRLWIAVGEGGTVLRSRDGETFEPRPAPTHASLVGVALVQGLILAVAEDGAVLRSRDGGDSFTAIATLAAEPTSIAIAATGVFVGTRRGLWRSRDRGVTFSQVAAEPIQALGTAPDGTVYAVGGWSVTYATLDHCGTCFDAGYDTLAVYRTTDGATWWRRAIRDPTTSHRWKRPGPHVPPRKPPSKLGSREVGPPFMTAPRDSRTLAIGPRGELFIGAGKLYSSTDRGSSFATSAALPGALWAASGRVVASSELAAPTLAGHELLAIAATPNGRVYAVGASGTIVVRSPAGWTKLATPTGPSQRLFAIHAADDYVVVVGEGGVILHSTDGRTFVHRASDRLEHLTAVWGIGDEVFAAGNGAMLRSRDRGRTWESSALASRNASAIWGTADDLFLLGDRMFHSADRGKTWAPTGKLDGIYTGMWGHGTVLFIVGIGGKIARSDDRGATWSAVASGTAIDLRRIWGRGDDLYAVGGSYQEDGVVLRSRDRGATWREELVPAEASMLDITGTADQLWVLGWGASILRGRL